MDLLHFIKSLAAGDLNNYISSRKPCTMQKSLDFCLSALPLFFLSVQTHLVVNPEPEEPEA